MRKIKSLIFALLFLAVGANVHAASSDAKKYKSVSGIYPHLAMWNSEGECGTGAVVPWAGKLWAVTYGPHVVYGSDDRLYEIDEDLNQNIRKESLGGTHANRMIHEPSKQLVIGCYFITEDGLVRAIPRNQMPGRLTGNARSVTDDANKVYFATMEEALYEVDVNTLEVNEIIRDSNLQPHKDNADGSKPVKSNLHGYHGKGLYSGFGKVFYSNNGVHNKDVERDPTLKSGALGEWKPGDKDWAPIRICQFTEITGKDGIKGSADPANTPLWSLGFDAKSVILMLRENDGWTSFRLPKASHSYDGSHGWNTEWPRIRDIGEDKYMMTMHGAFWAFPPEFDSEHSQGIRMRSNYLKVVGDFCEWNGKVVLGCDDSALAEFYNKRDMKSDYCSPLKSNSNLVFMDKKDLDKLGPTIGRGSVFLRDNVKACLLSEPMLVGGFANKVLSLSCSDKDPVKVMVRYYKNLNEEIGAQELSVSASAPVFMELPDNGAEWVRIQPLSEITSFTAHFNLSNPDKRSKKADKIFDGIAVIGEGAQTDALMRSTKNKTLAVVGFEKSKEGAVQEIGTYELNQALELKSAELDPKLEEGIRKSEFKAKGVSYDNGSTLVIEDGKRYRLPFNPKYADRYGNGFARIAREVSTERDLFNFGGTFYELPARNAQGVAKIRPIASHNLDVFDYASYSGLMFISGMSLDAVKIDSEHVVVSENKKLSLWAGAIDDLWKLGKPVGQGDVWRNNAVKVGELSDQYIMTGYDKKTLRISSKEDVKLDVEVDVDGTGLWLKYGELEVKGGETFEKKMPADFVGYWLRFKAGGNSSDITATVVYE